MELNSIKLRPEYERFLRKWAQTLNVSIEVLLHRIVVDTIEGHLYVEKIPNYSPITIGPQRRKTEQR
jgi:hypothetical protein